MSSAGAVVKAVAVAGLNCRGCQCPIALASSVCDRRIASETIVHVYLAIVAGSTVEVYKWLVGSN